MRVPIAIAALNAPSLGPAAAATGGVDEPRSDVAPSRSVAVAEAWIWDAASSLERGWLGQRGCTRCRARGRADREQAIGSS